MISVSNVSKRFYTQPVLQRVSFEVPSGGAYVILGQSGAGKSVLLKILAGLVPPDEGHVRIESRDLGMVFQKNALFDSLTVEENLDFCLRSRTALSPQERKKEVATFLDWVGLGQSARLFPDELSGGMQKRLGIARALIVKPQVLFYDEPTAGLDPITSRVIAELILRLKKELGTTLVVVTSDVMRAFQLGDAIGILARTPQGAALLAAGTPEQAQASENPAVRQFLRGLTQGPLTPKDETEGLAPAERDEDYALKLAEGFDVDFF